MADALAALLPLAAEDHEEGIRVIMGMLIVGLIFLAVILLGDLVEWRKRGRH